MGKGDYAVLIDGAVLGSRIGMIFQETFDNLIRWVPDIPPEPHTEDQHKAIETLAERLKETLRRERHASGNRIGDADVPHCSSMTRAAGSPDVHVNGIPWSRQGDHNTPTCYRPRHAACTRLLSPPGASPFS